MLTITIDWLSVNFRSWVYETGEFERTYASFGNPEDYAPRFGYASARVDSHGTVVMWNDDRADMGHHIIFNGTALRNIFSQTKIQPRALLSAVIDAGGNISRLDLAKDLTEKSVDLEAIYQQIEQGHSRGTTRKYSRVTSNDKGYTIYIGSRQSERYIRLYDKAAEQSLSNHDWYRLECETKGVFARSIGIALSNTEDWAQVFDNVIRGAFWLPLSSDWLAFFPLGVVPIGLPKESKMTDRERWIESQVIPAVARHYIDNPNSVAVARLLLTLYFIDNPGKL